jgi:quercetin dioxygenase-like cupin family protein
MSQTEFMAVDTQKLPWEERIRPEIGKALYRKVLFTEPETGCFFQLVRYPAGVVNPKHTHPCGHAMYVLEGNLVTHRGTYGPGSFVWFPEGEVMEHGATQDQDVIVLLVTNKPFEIHYVS